MKPAHRLTIAAFVLVALNFSTTVLQAQDYVCTTNNGTITITGYTGPGGTVIIPDTINGLPVTRVGDSAFWSCANLTSLTVPSTVTDIGNSTFSYCGNLTSVTLVNGITNIGHWAFSDCTNLAGITIPGSVTRIGSGAFSGCPGLATITVELLNGLYCSVDGVLFNKSTNTLVEFPGGKMGSYTVPKSVISIGNWAFCKCSNLTSVTIPESVANIGVWAFYGCNLTDVEIPYGVVSIGQRAFSGCANLASITVDPLNRVYSSVNGVLFNDSANVLVEYPGGKAGGYTVPNGVVSIGQWAFAECTSLTSIEIPEGVTGIGDGAFYWCTSLTRVTIPDSVTRIGIWAFYGCNKLTSITLPGAITGIEDNMFSHCVSLTNVTVPHNVVRIGKEAFYCCNSLTGVHFEGNAPNVGASVFSYAEKATAYYLPGTTGWDLTIGGRPTAVWALPHPVILTTPPQFGIETNGFGFRISWATNASVVVEASPTLANPAWSPVSTNTLTDGWSDFRDPQWADHPARFYRVRLP